MLTGGRQHRLLLQCYQGRRKRGVHELWPMRSCRGGGGGAEHGAAAAAAAEEWVPSALARGSGLDGAVCVCVGGEGCRARGGGGVAERTGPRLGPRRCGGGVPSPGAHLAAEAARGGRGRLGSGPLSHGAQRGVAFATGSWGVVERGIARRSGQAPTAPRARGGAHRLLVAKGDECRLFELSVRSRSAASLAMSVLCVRTAAAAGAGPWPGGEQERADLDPAERARRRRVGAAPATSHARRQPRGHACSCAARPCA